MGEGPGSPEIRTASGALRMFNLGQWLVAGLGWAGLGWAGRGTRNEYKCSCSSADNGHPYFAALLGEDTLGPLNMDCGLFVGCQTL